MHFIIDLFSRFLPKETVDEAALVAAGERAVATALAWWRLDIYDPRINDTSANAKRSKNFIDEFCKLVGWTWIVPYDGDGEVEWCGIFAGAAWRKAGLKLDIAKTFFPSTWRLVAFAHYKPYDEKNKNQKPKKGPYRRIMYFDEKSKTTDVPTHDDGVSLESFIPRAGDVVIIGPAGKDKHICLLEKVTVEDGVCWFHTIEGNGTGTDPDDNKQHGVVRAKRRIGGTGWHVRKVIRLAPSDVEVLGGL